MRLRRRPVVIDNKKFLEREVREGGRRRHGREGRKKVVESNGSDDEFFGIDNILSEEDFKKAKSISYRDGCIRFGVIVRLETI